MDTGNIFIAHPINAEQIEALKAIVKAFNIKFEVKYSDENIEFLSEIENSLKQVKEMTDKKLPKQSAKEFLNEI